METLFAFRSLIACQVESLFSCFKGFQGTLALCDCSADRSCVKSLSPNQSDNCWQCQINSVQKHVTFLKRENNTLLYMFVVTEVLILKLLFLLLYFSSSEFRE